MPNIIKYLYLNFLIDKDTNGKLYSYLFFKIVPTFGAYRIAEDFWAKYKTVPHTRPLPVK